MVCDVCTCPWQEECDVLSVVLTKYLNQINYAEFKVVLPLDTDLVKWAPSLREEVLGRDGGNLERAWHQAAAIYPLQTCNSWVPSEPCDGYDGRGWSNSQSSHLELLDTLPHWHLFCPIPVATTVSWQSKKSPTAKIEGFHPD